MIEALQSLSIKLRWAKPIVFIVGVTFLFLFFATIFGLLGITTDIYLIPSILGVTWAALFFFLISTFPYVPAKPDKGEKLLAKLQVLFRRGIYYIFGVIFVGLTIAVVTLSFKLFGIWRANF